MISNKNAVLQQLENGIVGYEILFFGQCARDRRFQFFAAQVFTDHFAVSADEHAEGDGFHTVFLRKLVLPALAVVKLRPRHARPSA